MPAATSITPVASTKRAKVSVFTLTQATYYGRQLIKFGSITLVVLIVGRMLLTAAIAYWQATHPEPPPPPTIGFGKLPALVFPEVLDESKPQTYLLELPNGEFSEFVDRAKVFLMPKTPPNLLADQKIKELAKEYDFTDEPQLLDSRTYRWTKSQPLEMGFQMDLLNHTFSLRSNYLSRTDLLLNNELPEDFEAVSSVKTILSAADMLPEDVATTSGKVSFWKSLGGELQSAVSLSDADFLRVDLDRLPIDDQFSMYSPDGSRGSISAVISGSKSIDGGVVELEYHYFPVDYTQVETYPLRTPQDAWKILQAGEGYVAHASTFPEVTVRSVDLGYYDDWQEQDYLQPIYVFEGDGGFVGYVSAIKSQFILSPAASEVLDTPAILDTPATLEAPAALETPASSETPTSSEAI